MYTVSNLDRKTKGPYFLEWAKLLMLISLQMSKYCTLLMMRMRSSMFGPSPWQNRFGAPPWFSMSSSAGLFIPPATKRRACVLMPPPDSLQTCKSPSPLCLARKSRLTPAQLKIVAPIKSVNRWWHRLLRYHMERQHKLPVLGTHPTKLLLILASIRFNQYQMS